MSVCCRRSVRGQCDSMMSDILGQSLLCQNSVAGQPNLLTSMAVIKVRTLNDGKKVVIEACNCLVTEVEGTEIKFEVLDFLWY